ncbi:signal peptidase I [Nocardioides sp. LHG3406-4]|uniref:signal peptidase I n=1 Tax=Nocardioides sp. LHG3406-4 TaxID=2804575 RepID=UPI003CE9A7D5
MILACAALLTAMVLVPRLAGATPYTVLTGSMTPTYPPGTLVVAKPADPSELGVGVPITYQLDSGQPAVVTHRIVQVQQNSDGEMHYVTRGDANNANDPEPVRPVQIRGRVWYALPYVGYLNSALNGSQHQALVLMVAGGLALYAAYMFASAAFGRLRDGDDATDGAAGEGKGQP